MSYGANNTTKTANNNLAGTSNLALNNLYPQVTQAGSNLLNIGNSNTASGTGFLNTLLAGNSANTSAALAPSTDQIRNNTNATSNAINTLMPRGAGRTSALFSNSFAPMQQQQQLFNTERSNAGVALPQIGLQQSGQGTNLFGTGAQTLNAANSSNNALANSGQQTQQNSNALASGIGGGLFNLLTTPLTGGSSGGGSSLLGLLGLSI